MHCNTTQHMARLTLLVLLGLMVVLAHSVPIALQSVPTKDLGGSVGPSWIPAQGDLSHWGQFFVPVGFGQPDTQYFQLQLNTKTADTFVYGWECGSWCGQPLFYPYKTGYISSVTCDENSTCKRCKGNQACGWETKTSTGTTIGGTLLSGVITVGPIPADDNLFGLINYVMPPNSFLKDGIQGVLGFGFDSIFNGYNILVNMANTYDLYGSFSVCLTPSNSVLDIGTSWAYNSNVTWTKVQSSSQWSVHVKDIQVGGKSIGVGAWYINCNSVIVDVSTPLMIVNKRVMTGIQNQLTSMCSNTPLIGVCNVTRDQSLFAGKCFQMTPNQLNQFPTISFQFDKTDYLPIYPQDYLWEGTQTPGVYCFGIREDDKDTSVLGIVFMQRYHVIFNYEDLKIGFAPLSTCSAPY